MIKCVKKTSDIMRIIDEELHRTGDDIKITILRSDYMYDILLKLEGEKT